MSMVESPQQRLEPNRTDMKAQLDFLFGNAREYDDGQVEIAVCMLQGERKVWQSQLFTLDRLDDAVNFAATQNAAGHNIYFGAALRDPDVPPFGRASDADHYATPAVYADLDTAEASSAAAIRTKSMPPDFVVCTGQHPHLRLQPYWRLEEPLTDPEAHRALCGGLADSLQGDRAVTNPSRIMRLAGSIAWPTKPGRVPEMTYVVPLKYQPRGYAAEQVARAYPASNKVFSIDATGKNDSIERIGARNSLGLDTGILDDGREAYMRNTILAVLLEFVGTNGAIPDQQELFDAAWPQYSAHVDLSRPGRGADEMARKIQSTLRRLERGQLRDRTGKVMTFDSMAEEYRSKIASRKVERAEKQFALPPTTLLPEGGRFQWITRENGLAPVLTANWLVKRVLPAEGIGVIFGRPGSGKTFTVMDIAMHVADGVAWRGLKVRQAPVSYVSPEAGRLGINRVIGWCRHHGRAWPAGFRLSPAGINLCSAADDANALIADVKANQPGCKLVVIDTLNRAMAGGDENSGEDMGRFVALCDLIAKELQAFVLVVHHSGKDAAKGSRGHSSLLGAVSLELEVTKEQGEPGTIKVSKMRDGEDGAEYGFDIESVPLGLDEDGEEVTTGISVNADMSAIQQARAAEPRGQIQRTIADAFIQFVDDHGRPNPAGTGFAEQGKVRVVEEGAFTDFAAGKLLGEEKRKRARQGIRGLIERGYFVVNNGYIWRS